jgi:hypothetical protein
MKTDEDDDDDEDEDEDEDDEDCIRVGCVGYSQLFFIARRQYCAGGRRMGA